MSPTCRAFRGLDSPRHIPSARACATSFGTIERSGLMPSSASKALRADFCDLRRISRFYLVSAMNGGTCPGVPRIDNGDLRQRVDLDSYRRCLGDDGTLHPAVTIAS